MEKSKKILKERMDRHKLNIKKNKKIDLISFIERTIINNRTLNFGRKKKKRGKRKYYTRVRKIN